MNSKTDFYMAKFSVFAIEFYVQTLEYRSKMSNFHKDVSYRGLSLEELAVCAKDDDGAMNELLVRVSKAIYSLVFESKETHPFLQVEDMATELRRLAVASVRKYDSEKGKFLTYLYSVFRRAIDYSNYRTYKKILNQKSYLGIRVPLQEVTMFSDVTLQDVDEWMRNKIDLEDFRCSLKGTDMEIFTLYLDGFTNQKIAETLFLSISKVNGTIHRLKEQARKKLLGTQPDKGK